MSESMMEVSYKKGSDTKLLHIFWKPELSMKYKNNFRFKEISFMTIKVKTFPYHQNLMY